MVIFSRIHVKDSYLIQEPVLPSTTPGATEGESGVPKVEILFDKQDGIIPALGDDRAEGIADQTRSLRLVCVITCLI